MLCPYKAPGCNNAADGKLNDTLCEQCFNELSDFCCILEHCWELTYDLRDQTCGTHWHLRDSLVFNEGSGEWSTLADIHQ